MEATEGQGWLGKFLLERNPVPTHRQTFTDKQCLGLRYKRNPLKTKDVIYVAVTLLLPSRRNWLPHFVMFDMVIVWLDLMAMEWGIWYFRRDVGSPSLVLLLLRSQL